MAGTVGANVPVSRILGGAAGIADFGDEDTFGLTEGLFNTPKATGGKDGGLGGGKFQRYGVEAIAAAGWFWSVGEDVTEVRIATGAKHLDTFHPVAVVGDFSDVVGVNRFEKTWPAGTGVELSVGIEQRQAAANTRVDAVLVIVVKCAAECRLGAFTTGNRVLFRSQELPPFGVSFSNFLHGVGGPQGEQANRNQNNVFHGWKVTQADSSRNWSVSRFNLRCRWDILAMYQEEHAPYEAPDQCCHVTEQRQRQGLHWQHVHLRKHADVHTFANAKSRK